MFGETEREEQIREIRRFGDLIEIETEEETKMFVDAYFGKELKVGSKVKISIENGD